MGKKSKKPEKSADFLGLNQFNILISNDKKRVRLLARHQQLEAIMNNCSEKILFVEDVARLIGKSVNTIRTCATNKKFEHLIPRPFKLPHSRRLCWFEHDVQRWIKSGVPVEIKPTTRRPEEVPKVQMRLADVRAARDTARDQLKASIDPSEAKRQDK